MCGGSDDGMSWGNVVGARRKPLTAEILELNRKWVYWLDEHTSMTDDEIRELTDEVVDTFPVLLSMLTPPPDAFFYDVRHGDMSKAAPDYDTSPQHVEQTDTLQGAAPIPEDVNKAIKAFQRWLVDHGYKAEEYKDAIHAAKTIIGCYRFLTRRLAEVDAKKNAWKEQAIKIQHDLETIGERLINAEGKVAKLSVDLTEEKRLDGLEADMLKSRADAAEAKIQRIMAWARGRCEACGSTDARTAIFGGCRDCTYSLMNSCGVDNWTPLKEWEVRP